MHGIKLCISSIIAFELGGEMIVVQSASFIRLTYAGAVNLVDRNRTAHPSLLRAKKETMASRHEGVRRATTGAFSRDESFGGQPLNIYKDHIRSQKGLTAGCRPCFWYHQQAASTYLSTALAV